MNEQGKELLIYFQMRCQPKRLGDGPSRVERFVIGFVDGKLPTLNPIGTEKMYFIHETTLFIFDALAEDLGPNRARMVFGICSAGGRRAVCSWERQIHVPIPSDSDMGKICSLLKDFGERREEIKSCMRRFGNCLYRVLDSAAKYWETSDESI
jgi:hypothetical protein